MERLSRPIGSFVAIFHKLAKFCLSKIPGFGNFIRVQVKYHVLWRSANDNVIHLMFTPFLVVAYGRKKEEEEGKIAQICGTIYC